jgi:acyl-coenzyme A thioesterase PaaI-like protein
MNKKAIQDLYQDRFSQCYGCGRLNDHGLKIKTYWDGDESVCSFQPEEYHNAFPGIVYGGLIASVIDCHSTATAAAAAIKKEGLEFAENLPIRYMTASLHVDYIKPTPIDAPMELRSKITEITDRKVIVETDLSVKGVLCARGRVVAVKIPMG